MDSILIAQRNQRIVWIAVTASVALLGLAQRDQRSFLSGASAPLTQSAFAAITPQSPGPVFGSGNGGGNGLSPRSVGRAGRSGQSGVPQFAALSGNTPAGGGGASVFDQPSLAGPSETAAPGTSVALADPGSGAANTGPGAGGGVAGSSPGGAQQAVSGAAPGAVPEAPMWAMMILGIGGIGCMMRRDRRRGRSSSAALPA